MSSQRISTSGSVSTWIEELRAGESSAATQLWNRYHQMLLQFARQLLRDDARRVTDEEDLVVAAFESFFCRLAAGQFPELARCDELWALLVTIIDRKAVNALRRFMADKRGGGRVVGHSTLSGENGVESVLASAGSAPPLPDVAASLSELFDALDDDMREVVWMRMDGYTIEEIGQRMNRSVATVERRLRLLRDQWIKELFG